MRPLLWVIAAAAAFTLICSPSTRDATLRVIFADDHGIRLPRRLNEYADRPLPLPYAGPRYRTWKNGVPQ